MRSLLIGIMLIVLVIFYYVYSGDSVESQILAQKTSETLDKVLDSKIHEQEAMHHKNIGNLRTVIVAINQAAQAQEKSGKDKKDLKIGEKINSEQSSVKVDALLELSKMGDKALEYIADIKRELLNSDAHVAQMAAFAVAKLGKKAVALCEHELAQMLSLENAEARSNALFALSKNKDVAKNHLPAINQTLKAPEFAVVDSALHTIAMMGPLASDSVAPVSELLNNSNPKLREEAAFSLGRVRNNDPESSRQLHHLSVSDPDPKVRDAAANALRLMNGGKQHINKRSTPEKRAEFEEISH